MRFFKIGRFAIRRGVIKLYHVLTRIIAVICNLNVYLNAFVAGNSRALNSAHIFDFPREVGIRLTCAERINDVFVIPVCIFVGYFHRHCFIITVTDINTFFVVGEISRYGLTANGILVAACRSFGRFKSVASEVVVGGILSHIDGINVGESTGRVDFAAEYFTYRVAPGAPIQRTASAFSFM